MLFGSFQKKYDHLIFLTKWKLILQKNELFLDESIIFNIYYIDR